MRKSTFLITVQPHQHLLLTDCCSFYRLKKASRPSVIWPPEKSVLGTQFLCCWCEVEALVGIVDLAFSGLSSQGGSFLCRRKIYFPQRTQSWCPLQPGKHIQPLTYCHSAFFFTRSSNWYKSYLGQNPYNESLEGFVSGFALKILIL